MLRRRRAAAGQPEPEQPALGAFDLGEDPRAAPPAAYVRGWALPEHGIDRIELEVEGAETVRARLLADPRPDIAALSSLASAPMAGWEAIATLPDAAPGTPVAATAFAVGPDGRRPLPSQSPAIVLESTAGRATADPDWVAELERRAVAGIGPLGSGKGPAKLIVFTHSLGLGGAQAHLQEILRPLRDDPAFECAVISGTDGPLRRELEAWGMRVHLVGELPRDGVGYESRMRELALVAQAEAPDLVLANTTIAFPGIDLAARLGLPAVWTIHESVEPEHALVFPPSFDDHVASRFRAAFAHPERIVFEADATRELYLRYAPDPSRLVRCDYGPSLERLDARRAELDRERLRAERGFAPGERVIVCVGTLEPRKSQAALAFGFSQVAAGFPDARLVLVGSSSSRYSLGTGELVGRLEERGEAITIVPVDEDVVSWYASADAFVLASDLESLPLSIIEAMACGVPVLSTSVFGVPELISDGDNGLLFEPNCLASLRHGLERLLSLDPGELAAIAAAGERSVRPHRDASHYAGEIRELLTGLLAAGAGRHS